MCAAALNFSFPQVGRRQIRAAESILPSDSNNGSVSSSTAGSTTSGSSSSSSINCDKLFQDCFVTHLSCLFSKAKNELKKSNGCPWASETLSALRGVTNGNDYTLQNHCFEAIEAMVNRTHCSITNRSRSSTATSAITLTTNYTTLICGEPMSSDNNRNGRKGATGLLTSAAENANTAQNSETTTVTTASGETYTVDTAPSGEVAPPEGMDIVVYGSQLCDICARVNPDTNNCQCNPGTIDVTLMTYHSTFLYVPSSDRCYRGPFELKFCNTPSSAGAPLVTTAPVVWTSSSSAAAVASREAAYPTKRMQLSYHQDHEDSQRRQQQSTSETSSSPSSSPPLSVLSPDTMAQLGPCPAGRTPRRFLLPGPNVHSSSTTSGTEDQVGLFHVQFCIAEQTTVFILNSETSACYHPLPNRSCSCLPGPKVVIELAFVNYSLSSSSSSSPTLRIEPGMLVFCSAPPFVGLGAEGSTGVAVGTAAAGGPAAALIQGAGLAMMGYCQANNSQVQRLGARNTVIPFEVGSSRLSGLYAMIVLAFSPALGHFAAVAILALFYHCTRDDHPEEDLHTGDGAHRSDDHKEETGYGQQTPTSSPALDQKRKGGEGKFSTLADFTAVTITDVVVDSTPACSPKATTATNRRGRPRPPRVYTIQERQVVADVFTFWKIWSETRKSKRAGALSAAYHLCVTNNDENRMRYAYSQWREFARRQILFRANRDVQLLIPDEPPPKDFPGKLLHSMEKMKFPNFSLHFITFAFPGIIYESLTILNGFETTAAEYVMAVVGCLLALSYIVFTHIWGSKAAYNIDILNVTYHQYEKAFAGYPSIVKLAFLPGGYWRSQTKFMARYGAIYELFGKTRISWITTIHLVKAVITSILATVHVRDNNCTIMYLVICGVFFAFAILFLVVRPHRRPTDEFFSVYISLATAVLVLALSQPQLGIPLDVLYFMIMYGAIVSVPITVAIASLEWFYWRPIEEKEGDDEETEEDQAGGLKKLPVGNSSAFDNPKDVLQSDEAPQPHYEYIGGDVCMSKREEKDDLEVCEPDTANTSVVADDMIDEPGTGGHSEEKEEEIFSPGARITMEQLQALFLQCLQHENDHRENIQSNEVAARAALARAAPQSLALASHLLLKRLKFEEEEAFKQQQYLALHAGEHDEEQGIKHISEALSVLKTLCRLRAEAAHQRKRFLSTKEILTGMLKKDVSELKQYRHPPRGVILTFEAVNLLLSSGSSTGVGCSGGDASHSHLPNRDSSNSLSSSLQLLNRDVLKAIEALQPQDIDEHCLKKLEKYVNNPDFDAELIGEQSSQACKRLCRWVLLVHDRSDAVMAIPKLEKDMVTLQGRLRGITEHLSLAQLKHFEDRAKVLEESFAELEPPTTVDTGTSFLKEKSKTVANALKVTRTASESAANRNRQTQQQQSYTTTTTTTASHTTPGSDSSPNPLQRQSRGQEEEPTLVGAGASEETGQQPTQRGGGGLLGSRRGSLVGLNPHSLSLYSQQQQTHIQQDSSADTNASSMVKKQRSDSLSLSRRSQQQQCSPISFEEVEPAALPSASSRSRSHNNDDGAGMEHLPGSLHGSRQVTSDDEDTTEEDMHQPPPLLGIQQRRSSTFTSSSNNEPSPDRLQSSSSIFAVGVTGGGGSNLPAVPTTTRPSSILWLPSPTTTPLMFTPTPAAAMSTTEPRGSWDDHGREGTQQQQSHQRRFSTGSVPVESIVASFTSPITSNVTTGTTATTTPAAANTTTQTTSSSRSGRPSVARTTALIHNAHNEGMESSTTSLKRSHSCTSPSTANTTAGTFFGRRNTTTTNSGTTAAIMSPLSPAVSARLASIAAAAGSGASGSGRNGHRSAQSTSNGRGAAGSSGRNPLLERYNFPSK